MIVLCIDDDLDDAELLSSSLKHIDPANHFYHAADGKKGLSMLEKMPAPDLIFLDINMPVMDGRETLRRIRSQEQWHHLPVIILSTYMSRGIETELLSLGATACRMKADSFAAYNSTIEEVVKAWTR